MATVINKAISAPTGFIKLFSGNWVLKYDTAGGGVGTSGSYSTDQGTSWYVIDDDLGKVEVYNSYLFVSDDVNLTVWQLPRKARSIIES